MKKPKHWHLRDQRRLGSALSDQNISWPLEGAMVSYRFIHRTAKSLIGEADVMAYRSYYVIWLVLPTGSSKLSFIIQ